MSLRNREGFALPLALLVMIVLTVGITAGLKSTNAEVINNSAHRGDNKAYFLAQAGLEKFIATRNLTGLCASGSGMNSSTGGTAATGCLADPTASNADSEWVTIGLTKGSAKVTAVMVRKYISDVLPALYFIRSVGYDSSSKLTGASYSELPDRGVGMYAEFSKAVVNVQGAWFALSGLHKNGNAGLISGVDQCSVANGGSGATLAGGVIPSGGQFSGDVTPFQGSPAIDTTKTFAQMVSSAKLDWAGIISSNAISADFEVPQQSFPSSSWFTSNPNAWPVIRVHTNNFSLPTAGRGMIIADSNFVISGSNMWDGIVLIGGALTSNGNNTTAGATFAGLNYLLGGNPAGSSDDSDANGQKTYTYNSCNVSKASAGLRIYKARNNTWIDNIPVW